MSEEGEALLWGKRGKRRGAEGAEKRKPGKNRRGHPQKDDPYKDRFAPSK